MEKLKKTLENAAGIGSASLIFSCLQDSAVQSFNCEGGPNICK